MSQEYEIDRILYINYYNRNGDFLGRIKIDKTVKELQEEYERWFPDGGETVEYFPSISNVMQAPLIFPRNNKKEYNYVQHPARND